MDEAGAGGEGKLKILFFQKPLRYDDRAEAEWSR